MPVKPRHREIARIIANAKGSGRVLDLGCGEGKILGMLPAGYEKYGVDISKNALKLADNKDVILRVCDLNREFPPDKGFDFIICSEVLEHLENPYGVLKGSREALAEGGLFLATIPNVTHWKHVSSMLNGRFPDYDRTHVHFWDLLGFIRLLQDNGFRVIEHYPTDFYPYVFGKAYRWLKSDRISRLFGGQFLFVCGLKP